jgi:hypothetical protein
MTVINNISLWAMHRSGSTHFIHRLTNSMKNAGRDATNIGECTGWGGFIPIQENPILEEIQEFLPEGNDYVCPHITWQKDEEGRIVLLTVNGSLMGEIEQRLELLANGTWSNSILFKFHPWPTMGKYFDSYANAVLKNDFHHIILWRRSLYDWACSRFILRRTHSPHGVMKYDGNPWEFRTDIEIDLFLNRLEENLSEFLKTMTVLSSRKERTVMLETMSLNDQSKISFGDRCTLDLIPAETIKKGKTVFLDEHGLRKLPKEMLNEETQFILQEWADIQNEKYDWLNLDKNSGFSIP